jgi:hypothetical protein
MDRDDPLGLWLLYSKRDLDPGLVADQQARLRAALDRLEAYLDDPPKRPNLMDLAPRVWDALGGFDPDDLPRAQALYRRVVETGGTGTTYVQKALLELIAAPQDPASVPFWLEILDIRRRRDAFAKQRRAMALSALALLAVRQDDPAAHDALRRAAHHDRPEVRALAVQTLGRVYAGMERPLPPQVLDELAEVAVSDPAFGPRFHARALMRAADRPVPPDSPGGVYTFKVKFNRMIIWIGTSGWVYDHWRGIFYPEDLRQRDWFSYYAREFDTVEINNTFYRLPSEAAFDRWREQAPPGFTYAVKASRFLTHFKKLKDPQEPLQRFFERAGRLSETLGPVLYQLPPHWRANLPRFEHFLAALPPGRSQGVRISHVVLKRLLAG